MDPEIGRAYTGVKIAPRSTDIIVEKYDGVVRATRRALGATLSATDGDWRVFLAARGRSLSTPPYSAAATRQQHATKCGGRALY